ncbi:MAG: DUF1802 family protein [Candidatus Sumerlaeaceae bacterium]|nr:DUF1802 family protein [Candidatus Sumerlaeaceae bacterium]
MNPGWEAWWRSSVSCAGGKGSPVLEPMDIALKEWASVIRALQLGLQVVVLRKGGIAEIDGRFEVKHRQFLLYPTYEHQDEKLIVPEWRKLVRQTQAERVAGQVTISSWARVEHIAKVRDRLELERLGLEHIFAQAFLDARLSYKPDLPLYVLVLRVFNLAEPVSIEETPEYIGCRSWVELKVDVPIEDSSPVLTDEEFARRLAHFAPLT